MGRLGPKCSSYFVHRVRRAAWGAGRQRPSPWPLWVPHQVIDPSPREPWTSAPAALKGPSLGLDITAFLLLGGEGAGLFPCQATRSLTTGMEGSPSAIRTSEGGTAQSRQPWAPSQYQAAPTPPGFRSSLGLVLTKIQILPNCPKARSWGSGSFPSPDLGAKVRAGQDPGGRATGSTERSLAEG